MIARTTANLMISRSKHFRVTLEQIRIYKKQPKHSANPCSDVMMKLVNAMEASGGKINGPVYKYVKDVEECLKAAKNEEQKSGKAGTLYYLSQYLDLNKFKQK
ncbi:hypothetical protein IV203_023487 [Nitzschia inconspicua]|uniref:Uncharacterized protein n=1 Tax=Nitzschia inconspicua TaxID=303405 RepID=A0A9K3KEB5_9STRA|nr:hypothetical protein IV203_023487 [Nitzschia inconspicua]